MSQLQVSTAFERAHLALLRWWLETESMCSIWYANASLESHDRMDIGPVDQKATNYRLHGPRETAACRRTARRNPHRCSTCSVLRKTQPLEPETLSIIQKPGCV